MKVTGKTVSIAKEDRNIYAKLSNCNNFGQFLPEQIQNWQSTETTCRFSIPGIATLNLCISERIEFSKIVYVATNDKNIPVTIVVFLNGHGDNTDVTVEIEAGIPNLLSGMVQKPLQNLVDTMAEKIKKGAE